MTDTVKLPLYQSHKQVRAVRIAAMVWAPGEAKTIVPDDDSIASFVAPIDWAPHYKNVDDDLGYYVVYSDGYASWSPTAAFEAGYTQIPETAAK